jgi:hypothetical protein
MINWYWDASIEVHEIVTKFTMDVLFDHTLVETPCPSSHGNALNNQGSREVFQMKVTPFASAIDQLSRARYVYKRRPRRKML